MAREQDGVGLEQRSGGQGDGSHDTSLSTLKTSSLLGPLSKGDCSTFGTHLGTAPVAPMGRLGKAVYKGVWQGIRAAWGLPSSD